jgi:hypothetical protein
MLVSTREHLLEDGQVRPKHVAQFNFNVNTILSSNCKQSCITDGNKYIT